MASSGVTAEKPCLITALMLPWLFMYFLAVTAAAARTPVVCHDRDHA
jgi:hypothetical protein